MFPSQSNHFFLCTAGRMFSRPSFTASMASAAICLQSTHHWGLRTGSMTSLVREDKPRRMPGLGREPL
eukprot:767624-Hanusia_phi.AAC.1